MPETRYPKSDTRNPIPEDTRNPIPEPGPRNAQAYERKLKISLGEAARSNQLKMRHGITRTQFEVRQPGHAPPSCSRSSTHHPRSSESRRARWWLQEEGIGRAGRGCAPGHGIPRTQWYSHTLSLFLGAFRVLFEKGTRGQSVFSVILLGVLLD